ncbi:MAG: hypothetical protein JXB08_05515 [Bacilli bacterium]|nr:hypothetical protein [Bacilli bacterium]MBN2877509.1 hypothetical protein [Bacilli bacterium]
MADNDKLDRFDNFKQYEDKLKMASEKEQKLFEDFHTSIQSHAKSHKHTTLNNLHEVEQSLSELKEKAELLKDSVFFHEETVIVDRQAIISQTEDRIHEENRNILHYEYGQAGERIDSLDYLNKALIQIKYNYFDRFKDLYTNQILDYNDLYQFYQDKASEFDQILNHYQEEILKSFQELDKEITDMDDRITFLMQQKNLKLNDVNHFYQREMNYFLDNQFTFSLDTDPTSPAMRSLIADKISQLDTFKQHLLDQEIKVKEILQQEYKELFDKTVDRMLKRRGNELFENVDFFYSPDKFIRQMKADIAEAEDQNFVTLKHLINRYNKAIHFKREIKDIKAKAKKMTRGFLNMKKQVYLEYQKENRNLIFQMEKYYKLYIELLKIDPFLAQIIGDNSTKIVKDEINFLSILQMNKEHRINVNFDIKTLKLKQQINEVESKLAYQSEKLMIEQDMNILGTLRDIQLFFSENQGNSALIYNSLSKEKLSIERLESAVNYHLEYLVKESNLNRKFLSMITQVLESDIRDQESHNIRTVDATSKIKLALKQFDILALHYTTLYENEKRFLVLQSNRVSEESKINNEFILTTFENQMRFAGEQLMLANDEYKLRVESIMKAFDEERIYYQDIVKHRIKGYQEREKNISDEYQAKLYYDTFMVQELEDNKQIKAYEKQIEQNKKVHDGLILNIEKQIAADNQISDARRRLRELDAHLEVALQDAETIRQDTIDEMTELYEDAKSRFESLKPYLENKVNILDPTFYRSLERIQERHAKKIKAAELELDEATKDLLQNYLVIFFEEQPHIDKELYLSQIEQLQEERVVLQEEYSKNIQRVELNHSVKMEDLDRELKDIYNNIDHLRTTVLKAAEKEIDLKKIELDTLDKRYESDYQKKTASFQTEINTLTSEYNTSLIENQRYYTNLSDAFNTILKTYHPYLKAAQNNKVIKQVVKTNEKRMERKKARETRELIKNSKQPNYIPEQ